MSADHDKPTFTEWVYASDHLEFEAYAQSVREAAVALLLNQFGPRCVEYEPDCPCCQRWKLLDQLLENPHDAR